MAMGKRNVGQQGTFWIPTAELPRTPGHPFYERLNQIFDTHGFDRFVEKRCSRFYANTLGRSSGAPEGAFGLLLDG